MKPSIAILILFASYSASFGAFDDGENKPWMERAMYDGDAPASIANPFLLPADSLVTNISLKTVRSLRFNGVVLDFGNARFQDALLDPVSQVQVRLTVFGKSNFAAGLVDFTFVENGRSGVFESGGCIDLSVSAKGKPLRLASGASVVATVPIDAGISSESRSAMNIYSYDAAEARWKYESEPVMKTVDGKESYVFDVTHFSLWNIDHPIEEHACVRGRVKIEGVTEGLPVTVVASGIDYMGESVRQVTNGGTFTVDVKRESRINLFAYSGETYGGGKNDFAVGTRQGTSFSIDKYIYKYDCRVKKATFDESWKWVTNDDYTYWNYDNEPVDCSLLKPGDFIGKTYIVLDVRRFTNTLNGKPLTTGYWLESNMVFTRDLVWKTNAAYTTNLVDWSYSYNYLPEVGLRYGWSALILGVSNTLESVFTNDYQYDAGDIVLTKAGYALLSNRGVKTYTK